MARPRHTDKDIEAFLRKLEAQDWVVEKGKKYYKARCPCGDHQKTIHVSPSNPNYLKNTSKLVARETCWEDK